MGLDLPPENEEPQKSIYAKSRTLLRKKPTSEDRSKTNKRSHTVQSEDE
jgi:hypothetical protein